MFGYLLCIIEKILIFICHSQPCIGIKSWSKNLEVIASVNWFFCIHTNLCKCHLDSLSNKRKKKGVTTNPPLPAPPPPLLKKKSQFMSKARVWLSWQEVKTVDLILWKLDFYFCIYSCFILYRYFNFCTVFTYQNKSSNEWVCSTKLQDKKVIEKDNVKQMKKQTLAWHLLLQCLHTSSSMCLSAPWGKIKTKKFLTLFFFFELPLQMGESHSSFLALFRAYLQWNRAPSELTLD